MPNPVAANDLNPISGSLQTSRISYGVETAGKNYGQNYNGTTWYSDIPQNGSQYTIISDNYTANYYVSRSNAGGAYVEGGLPAVDEYSAPVFWMTAGTSSLDIITIVNGLPDRIGQTPFSSGSQALNWIASSSNYFAVGPPFEQIDADSLKFYLNAGQIISYPTTQSTWYDISGNGINGTLYNGPTWDKNGWFIFDGTDDYVDTFNTFPVSQSGQFSVCGLINIQDHSFRPAAAAGIIGKGHFYANSWDIWLYNDERVFFETTGNTVNVDTYYLPSDPLTAGRWYFFAATYNNTAKNLWINGTQYSNTYPGPGGFTNGNNVLIARRSGDASRSLIGSGSSFSIYDRALTSAEVSQNYYGGPVITGSISGSYYANNLVSYASGSTATYNLSANIISGSLQNGVAFSPLNGGYWSFDGSDDRILLEGSTTNAWTLGDGTLPWTVNAWVRTTTTVNALGAGSIFSNSSGGPVASMLGINAGVITYWHYNNTWLKSSGTITINDGNWHMLTWVNFSNSTMDFYIDGRLDTAGVDSSLNAGGTNPLDVIGASWAAYYQGDIASLQINKGKAFTAAEVLQQYNATK